jgi:DNA-binding MarR family transcriptional regulator
MPSEQSRTEELHTLGALLRTSIDALMAHAYQEIRDAGFPDLRSTHSAVFGHITRTGCRITELAERARMTKQSMAELVEYLRDRGYVTLVADPSDRRAKLVQLTARGWKAHSSLVRSSRGYERQCARELGEGTWRQLRELLERFAAWSARQPKPSSHNGE